MLWYKAWLETRWRFLLCLGGLVFCCGFFVLAEGTGDNFKRLPSWAFTPREARELLFRAHQGLVALFPIAAILLGMGGILREKATGVASFTLGLPISRTRLMLSRIGMGTLQTLILSFAPWIAMLAVVYFYLHQPISIAFSSSLLFALISGGLLLFAMAVLVSCVIEGEYTAPVAAFGIFVVNIYGTVLFNSLREWNVIRFMRLQEYVDRGTWTIKPALPLGGIAIAFALTILLALLSLAAVERRDF
jgi:ABC-2 type transport system permease protein